MGRDLTTNPAPEVEGASCPVPRKHGRVMCQEILCSLGTVHDLSASGMRVRTRESLPKDQAFGITIRGLDGPILVSGRVVWTRRCGLFKREMGIRFTDLPPATIEALRRLAHATAYNETIRPGLDALRKAG